MVIILRIIVVISNLYCIKVNAENEEFENPQLEWLRYWAPVNDNYRRTSRLGINSMTASPPPQSISSDKPILRSHAESQFLESMLRASKDHRDPNEYLKIGRLTNYKDNGHILEEANKHIETIEEMIANGGLKSNFNEAKFEDNVRALKNLYKGSSENRRYTNENHGQQGRSTSNQKHHNRNRKNEKLIIKQNQYEKLHQNGHGHRKNNDNPYQNKLKQSTHVEGGLSRIPKLQPEFAVGKIFPLLAFTPLPAFTTLRAFTPFHTIPNHNKNLRQDSPELTTENALKSTKVGEEGDGESLKFLSPYGLHDQLQDIMKVFTKANVTIEKLGHTAEYKDIIIMKITERKDEGFFRTKDKYMDEPPEKKIIFIVHGLSVMGLGNIKCLHEVQEFKILLSFYLKHLHHFDIFIIPIANPDGYSAVMGLQSPFFRYWNKNMSPQIACNGVVLDRNFEVAWNVSKNVSSCSLNFPGTSAFSEPETKAIHEILHIYGLKIIAYIHVHAGTFDSSMFKGDAILYPKGFTDDDPDDDKYIDLKNEIEETMKNASFKVMSVAVEKLYNWYGKIGGSSVDYAATVYGIPFAMEFVMQPYDNTRDHDGTPPTSFIALIEIWGRLIKSTFNYLYKTEESHLNEVNLENKH